MTATNQPSLEDVLDMLLAAYKAPTQEAVADFAERFPAYRADILDFAADWAEEEHLPIPEPLTDAQEARVFSRAQSFLQNMLHEHANPAVAARRSAAARSVEEPNAVSPSTRPGNRVVTSWNSQPLPSGQVSSPSRSSVSVPGA